MRPLELRIPPLALVVIVAGAMAALAYSVPVTVLVPARQIVSVCFVLAGALIAFAGVIAFRRHKTTVNPLKPEQSSSLVDTGVYRFSRNPMYLGFLFALVGWCIYLANGAAALLLPAFLAYMNRFQIQPEERALSVRFGSQYIVYSKSVRRWL